MTIKEFSDNLEKVLSKIACNYLDTPEGKKDMQKAQEKLIKRYFKDKYNV